MGSTWLRDAPITGVKLLSLTSAAWFVFWMTVAGVPAAHAAPVPNPTSCAGYAERRQYVSVQSWWNADPARGLKGTSDGHFHLEACIPEGEPVKGLVPFDVKVIMHDNPGRARYVSMVLHGDRYEVVAQKQNIGGLTCAMGTCSRWLHFDLDTRRFPRSGFQGVHFRGFITEPPVGRQAREMRASLNFQVRVSNGRPLDNSSRYPFLRGKGWYTHAAYCEAQFQSAIPDGPVRGVWSPQVAMVTADSQNSRPVTRYTVTLDPNFHAMPAMVGHVVLTGTGLLRPRTVAIDTATLTVGPHRLLLRADCDDRKLGSVNSGVVVVPFVVTR